MREAQQTARHVATPYYNTAFQGFTCAGAVLIWDNSD
jgi:hypothetical protein